MIKIWLDDQIEDPDTPNRWPPVGWTGVKTVEEGQFSLIQNQYNVENLSLDNDLGQDLEGYDLVKWLVDKHLDGYDYWPQNKPMVHSMNVVNAPAMRQLIDNYWPIVVSSRKPPAPSHSP